MKNAVVVLCAASALVACAAKKEGKFNEAQAKQTATSNIDTTVSLNGSTSDTAGKTAAAQFQSTSLASGATIITPMAMRLVPGLLEKSGAFAAGTQTCSNKKCTFQDYSDDGSGSSLTINGAIDWNGGHIVTGPDLTYKIKDSGLDWATTLKLDLTVDEASINGFIEGSGKGSVEGVGAFGAVSGAGWDYFSRIEYKAVTLANGKPTGGSVTVTADYTVGGQVYTGNGTINYP